VELLLMNFRKIPFTCSYQPGKANITLLGVFYWFAFTTYAYTMAALERWLLQDAVRWIVFFVLVLLALLALVLWRKTMSVEGRSIVFEDDPSPEVQTLGLNT
jgi:membrane protein implicated in regulation of membrane protease activity